MRVLVCVNPSRDVNGEFSERVINVIKKLGADVTKCMMTDNNVLSNCNYEYIVVLGGDGTILRAAPFAANAGAAVLGINLGRVGFLSAFGRSDVIETGLQKLVDGKLEIENRMLLDVGGTLVVNEAVIYRGLNPRPIRLDVQIASDKDYCLRTVKGDGLIIATPTGSTAYSLYAGGKPASADSENILYTPICADNAEPEVFGQIVEITVTLVGEGTAALSLDGNTPTPMSIGETIKIKKSGKTLKLVKRM